MKSINTYLWVVICSLSSVTLLEAQSEALWVLYANPATYLQRKGIDTTDDALLLRLVDTTGDMSASGLSSEASLLLAIRGDASSVSPIRARLLAGLQNIHQPSSDLERYIVALYLLRAPETSLLAHQFLDSMLVRSREGMHPFYETLTLRVLANLGDHSRFDVLEEIVHQSLASSYSLDPEIILSYGALAQYRPAVFELIRSISLQSDIQSRMEAIYLLGFFQDVPDAQSVLQTMALTDSSSEVRLKALHTLSAIYSDPLVLSGARDFAVSAGDSMQFVGAVMILEYFPSPYALEALQNIGNMVSSGFRKDFIRNTIRFYKPPAPDSAVEVGILLDSIRSHLHVSAGFHWLGNEEFEHELNNGLENAKKHLAGADSLNCARELRVFGDKVKRQYERKTLRGTKRFVTVEGYRFLYYSAQFIVDRLPHVKTR